MIGGSLESEPRFFVIMHRSSKSLHERGAELQPRYPSRDLRGASPPESTVAHRPSHLDSRLQLRHHHLIRTHQTI
jgi:hypothetical protein